MARIKLDRGDVLRRRAERRSRLDAERDRLGGTGVHTTARRDQPRVVVGPRRTRKLEQALALGERRLGVGIGVDEDVPVVEGGDQPEVPRAQHAVAEDIAGHVADTDRGDRVRVGVLAEHAGVSPHALPRAAGRDPHHLVVVAGAPAGREGVAEPEAVLRGDRIGGVAERGSALVGGDDEVRVVAVVDHRVGRMLEHTTDHVVGEIEHPAHELAVALLALDALLGRIGPRVLDDESALGAHRHDDRVLHHLGLHETEHLGAEVLAAVAPTDPTARDRPGAQVHALDPR